MNRTIENLVFESGGVKGVAYVGAIRALQERGVLQQVQRVAGTSAGAIMACLLALRFKPDEIHEAVFNMDFKSFEDDKSYRKVRSEYGLYAGDAFLEWMSDLLLRKGFNPQMTFAQLHKAGYPDLKVYAVDLYTQQLQAFSFLQTPDTIVLEAVRASMSIPLYFRAWQFSNGIPNTNLYVDGGVLLAYPFYAFEKEGATYANTLGLRLDNLNKTTEPHVFGYDNFPEYAKALFSALLKAQDAAFLEDKQAQSSTVRINDLGISGTNFDLSVEEKNALINEGYKATCTFLEQMGELPGQENG